MRLLATALLLTASTTLHAAPDNVANPALDAAIDRFLDGHTAASRKEMFQQISRATYLLPATPTADGQNQQLTWAQVDKVGSCIVAFSNSAQAEASHMAEAELLDMQAEQLWLTLDALKPDCLLLNPDGNTLPLRRSTINRIRQT